MVLYRHGWLRHNLRGAVVERRSLTGELSLSYTRPELTGDHLRE